MFLSFVIPVYNTERYVGDCIDSLLHQNIETDDYEIICVNDGSKDGSLEVLRCYEQLHSNIKVLDQKNAGVCAARNAGLSIAQGEYVWLIDSDDCIRPNCLNELRAISKSSSADRIVVGNYRFLDGEDPFTDIDQKPKNTIWQDSSACRSLFKNAFLNNNKIGFHYPELVYGEDALFMYEVKYLNPVTVTYDCAVYGYRDREGSASQERTQNDSSLLSTIREAEIMHAYYCSGRDDVLTVDRMMWFLYSALFKIAALPSPVAKKYIGELKTRKLFPLRRPKQCTIKQSFEVSRDSIAGRVHDSIYLKMTSYAGYHAMRLWNAFFKIKRAMRELIHK